MRVLLDTHILLWAASLSGRLPATLRDLMAQPDTELIFSAASIWEVSIKYSQRRPDFDAIPGSLRSGLLAAGYIELPVLGEHALAVAHLPMIHRDPFDRMLLAQAMVEGIELFTVDEQLARYPGPIRIF